MLTHSASATVREALLRTPPAHVICTVSSPTGRGPRLRRGAALRNGLEVELVEDDDAPSPARVGLAAAARRRHRSSTTARSATRRARASWPRRRRATSVPVVVACEVIKLAPMDAGDAPPLTAEEFELTPARADRLRRDRGGTRLAGRDRRPRRPDARSCARATRYSAAGTFAGASSPAHLARDPERATSAPTATKPAPT